MKDEILADFNVPWCNELLRSPDLVPLETSGRLPPAPWDKVLTNTLCNETLKTEDTIRAWMALRSEKARPRNLSPDFILLLSLGTGIGGFQGVAHGGFSALIMDQVMGMCASITFGPSGVTAESWLKFKKSIRIPGIVVCRAVATKVRDRRIIIEGSIEDGSGAVYCEAGSVYTLRKQLPKASL